MDFKDENNAGAGCMWFGNMLSVWGQCTNGNLLIIMVDTDLLRSSRSGHNLMLSVQSFK